MFKKFILLSLIVLFITNCDSDDSNNGSTDNYDKGVMLTNMADNIIIPTYQDLKSKLDVLKTAKNDFNATVNQTNLDNLRTAWLNAYKVWQFAEMLNIGESEVIQYTFQMNVYPASITEIENNITSETYDLTHVNNFDAVGFPAVDYLINGIESTDVAILSKFSTNTDAVKYRNYLSDLINQMDSLTNSVLNNWTSTYRDTFVASTGNTASSTVNKFVNDFIFYYEKGLRANKVGTPAGVYSANPLPTKVEAFYNKVVSKELLLNALKAVQDLFNGKHYNATTSGEGLKAYLDDLNKNSLTVSINTKINEARVKIQLLDANFYNQINTDNNKMLEAFDALQTVVVLLKVEMLQALNVSVDYVDADGD